MKVYVNVFTSNIGYSGWDLDLGFTILPKYKIKQILHENMHKWFIKGKNVYVRTHNCSYDGEQNSWIVKIFFN